MRGIYVADFETLATQDANITYVWGWGATPLENENIYVGNTIEDFFEYLNNNNVLECYFHNLAFDGAFIIDWLFREGFVYSDDPLNKSFKILKTSTNALYSITVYFKYSDKKHYKRTIFKDSLKKIPLKIAEIAKAWKMDTLKGNIDYIKYRGKNHIITEEEKNYIVDDVKILRNAILDMHLNGFNKLTIGSDCKAQYIKTIDNDTFKIFFPKLPLHIDKYLRKAYRGGYVYLKDTEKNKIHYNGLVFDVNSLYSYIMYTKNLPFGEPVKFEGEYILDKMYPHYITEIFIEFELKPKYIPIIQLKNNMSFIPTEYLSSSNGEMVNLFVTEIDLQLIKEHYNIIDIEFIGGYKFKSGKGFFKEYIDKFMYEKENSENGKRTIAKLFLNNLYGRLAINPIKRNKKPFFDDEKDIVRYELCEETESDGFYLPMGVYITSLARELTIREAQKNYDRFIYCDTDSLHLKGTELPDILIDSKKLGYWKLEGLFTRAKFLRAKTYIEEIDGKIHVTCTGLQKHQHNQVTFSNFKIGTTYFGKLRPKTIKGGIILVETTYNII